MKNTLKKSKEFDRVFKDGEKGYSHSLTLLYKPSKEMKTGICVSKKHGGSVERNRIKRLLRESLRVYLPSLKGTYHIVIVPKVLSDYSFEVFKRDIGFILKKKGLIDA